MTTELKLMAWSLVLAIVQILAFDIARTAIYGLKWNTGARDADMPPLPPYAERLRRAQNNLYETLPLFIAAVLALKALGISTSHTVLGAQLYFWGRVAYVPLYALGVPQVRSWVWIASFAGLVMLIWALVQAGL